MQFLNVPGIQQGTFNFLGRMRASWFSNQSSPKCPMAWNWTPTIPIKKCFIQGCW